MDLDRFGHVHILAHFHHNQPNRYITLPPPFPRCLLAHMNLPFTMTVHPYTPVLKHPPVSTDNLASFRNLQK